MSYQHGVTLQEQATSLISPVTATAGLPFVVGTAPINLGDISNVNVPVLCLSYNEAVKAFGMSNDFDNYTLCEAIKSHFAVFNVAPLVLVNVLNPTIHKANIKDEKQILNSDQAILTNLGVINSSVVVKFGDKTAVLNTDYALSFNNNAQCVITRLATGAIIAGATLLISYDVLKPSLVKAEDIIGTVDPATDKASGLMLTDEVFFRFNSIIGQILAPKYSKLPQVTAVMTARANSISGCFKAIAIADIDDTVANVYTKAPEWKNKNNYNDKNLLVTYGKVQLGDDKYHLSTQLASLICKTDIDNGGIPYVSPSNKSLKTNALLINDSETFLTMDKANYLNGAGIITSVNFIGGFKAWGSQTSAYPDSTDVKDVSLPIRRMFNWLSNTIILTMWQKIDNPQNKREINSIVDSINIWLNGLKSKEVILGGRLEFKPDENPDTDLITGLSRFHLYVTPPNALRQLDFIVEYDPSYLKGITNG